MRPWEGLEHAKYYLLGVYLSDGSLQGSGKRFCLRVRDQEFRDIAAGALRMLGIEHSCNEQYRKARTTLIRGKVAEFPAGTKFRVRVLKSREGDELSWWMKDSTKNKKHLPPIPHECLFELLAGVLDGDGSVRTHQNGGKPRIRVSGKCGYLPTLISRVRELGVHVSDPRPDARCPGHRRYQLNARDFVAAELFFRMSRKQEQIDRWIRAEGVKHLRNK